MSGDLLQRAWLLRDRKRFEDAIAVLHVHLAAEPESFHAWYELAVTRLLGGVDYRQGMLDIERALSLSPDSAAAHSIRSALLHASGRFQDALLAAGTAKSLNSEMAYAWFCEGNALLGMGMFLGAEGAARRALEIDPDHPSAPNLLSAALRLQQRFGEAQQVTDRQLERNPENAWTFANAGWAALNQGQRDKAENFFREALRLKPTLELARLGLRDAFKSRSYFYRFHMGLAFLHRNSELSGFIGAIAIVVGFFSVSMVVLTLHPAAVGGFIGSFLLMLGPMLADSLGHLILLKDRFARHSLNREEKLDCLFVGGLFFGGMSVLVLGAVVDARGMAALGGTMMGATVPGSLVFTNPSVLGRAVFGLTALGVVACGVMGVRLVSDPPAFAFLGMLAVFVTPKVSMIPALRRKKAG